MSIAASSSTTSYASVGSTISYGEVVTNTGAVAVDDVTVANALAAPAGASSSPACQSATAGASCAGAAAALPPGTSATFAATYSVTQKDLDNGAVVGSATATGTGPTGNINAAARVPSVPATVRPGLTLANSAAVPGSSGNHFSTAGQAVDYSYLIANSGNVTLDPVTLADGTAGLGPVTCPDTALAPGANETCTATGTTTPADLSAGSRTDNATATGTPAHGAAVTATSSSTVSAADSQPSAVTRTATVQTVPGPSNGPAVQNTTAGDNQGQNGGQGQAGQHPSISLQKSATVVGSSDNHYSGPDQTIDYSYLIKNTGSVPLSPVTLADPMPGLQNLRCPDNALFPGLTETCTATYTTTLSDVDAGFITNTATAKGTPTCGGAKVWATSSTTVYAEQQPSIDLKKTAQVAGSADGRYSEAGQTVDYSYLITNTGNVTLDPVTLLDPKPGLQDLVCPDTALVPGAHETCTATYTTTQADVDAGSVTNTGTATGTPPCGPKVTATSTATVYGEQSPAIAVVKTADVPAVSAVGQTVLYTFAVTNTGSVTLHNIDVSDAQAAPSLDSSLGPITCTSGTNGSITLAPGASDTCSAPYTVTQADLSNGSVTDTATATGYPPCGPPVTGTSTVTLPVTQITVTKAVNLTTIVAGSAAPIVYTITVTNNGTATTTDPIMVTDAAPTGTTLVSGSPTCATGGPPACSVSTSGSTITWTIAAGVKPGSAYTLTYAVTLNTSEVGGDVVTNTATWSGPSCSPPTSTCSSNTVTTTVTSPPVTKPATPPPAATPVSTAPASAPSAPAVIAFTGAFIDREAAVGMAALALGTAMVAAARRRRRTRRA
jgi:uncharacterized repeat protein (TIGR01451 family)